MSGQNARLSWVDTAKGISIILVVMMYSVFNVGQDAEGVGLFHYVIGFATPFRMPEFFLISGLFLDQVLSRTWKAYADRRVLHYFYFYAVWAVIHIVLKIGIMSAAPIEAATDLLWAIVEPYGVLWFIYLLAAFSAVTKLFYDLKAPKWAIWAFGAAFQMAHVQTGSYLVDQFCAYFVYFYSGYIFAPWIFKLVDTALGNKPMAILGLGVYAALNIALVFSPGFAVLPNEIQLGLAGLPGIRLILAIAGSLALCVTAGLITGFRLTNWLRWLGEHSIVVYLVFVLPMSAVRIIAMKTGILTGTSELSVAVLVMAVAAPVALYLLVKRTGVAEFLFERPAWAHIPGTPGSRAGKTAVAPAE
jgi:uncharacterized membrane protein YcfT